MSKHTAFMTASALRTQPSFVEDRFASGDGRTSEMSMALDRIASADPLAEIAAQKTMLAGLCAAIGLPSSANQDKPFAFSGGKAVIPIYGLLINRFPYSWGGFVTGYTFIQNQFRAAMADDDVDMIIFDVNSPGGSTNGCDELAAEIFAGRQTKPSVALVDGMCYSAAYYVASSAGSLWATPTSGVGGIGVYGVRMDFTGALEQMGIKADVVFAGANKLDSNPMVPFSSDAKARYQDTVDQMYSMFVSAVARNRADLDQSAVRDTKASCYTAADALSAKLIDGIGTPEYALEQIAASKTTTDSDDDPEDTDDDEEMRNMAATEAELSAAAAAAVAADRTRASAILSCEEAKDKPKLAQKLATMGMSAAEAKELLLAAAPETAAPVTKQDGNPLDTAMEKQGSPGVAPDNKTNSQERKLTLAEQTLAAQDAATGTKHLAAYQKQHGLAN